MVFGRTSETGLVKPVIQLIFTARFSKLEIFPLVSVLETLAKIVEFFVVTFQRVMWQMRSTSCIHLTVS